MYRTITNSKCVSLRGLDVAGIRVLSRLHLSVFGALTRPLSRNMTWWVETADCREESGHWSHYSYESSSNLKFTQYSESV